MERIELKKINAAFIVAAHAEMMSALKAAARFSVVGKMDMIARGGRQIERAALRTLAKDVKSSILYVGRNSAKDKCANCSPLSASVNWERFSILQDEITQEMWICECGRCYPSSKGKKNFPSLRESVAE